MSRTAGQIVGAAYIGGLIGAVDGAALFGEEIDVFLDGEMFRTGQRFSLGNLTFVTLHFDITLR